MDDLPEVFYLTTLDQIRTVSDPLRVRIVDRLMREPLTVTQLGEALGESPAKMHYHVRELERAGVVHLVETREKSGILEKYYRAVAKNFQIAPEVWQGMNAGTKDAVLIEFFQIAQRQALQFLTWQREHSESGETPLVFTFDYVVATEEEFRKMLSELREVMDRYSHSPSGAPGAREWIFETIAHPYISDSVTPSADASAAVPKDPVKRVRRIWMAGAFILGRKDFESVLAEGKRYDITVLGMLSIASDVPADLADRAIAHVRAFGKIVASPEVRAVLERKQKGGEAAPEA
jgi:DNA-binding transcriptional ArsR family regulator